MRIPFWKMHGAANDFILADDRAGTFPAGDRGWLARIMARRTGVGAEGVLLIQPSARADFRMRFFNPDGGEVDMCGNGARCIARLAHELGAAPREMRIETRAGLVRAAVDGDSILLHLTEPRDWQLNRQLEVAGQILDAHSVNSGVPHVMVEVPDLDAVNVQELGRALRYHPAFAPGGTNANFIQVTGPHSLRIRTYERGVEAETLACGTGIVACGLLAGRLGRVRPPVSILTAGGDTLEVNFAPAADGATGVTLRGPAVHVFQGTLEYP
ncbi:MAG TPA: diaminopimelate epimerase [Kiritimatiellia bacterium]|nr:diaminopimelate epimerase [Kiritimatiellia bacterium]HRZ12406.1 diaminopimelate epimerase [Kiritimatiellia bacterium]HSA17836.1 diaminopimelate epimerase [Kiritimatiellia bacterium]